MIFTGRYFFAKLSSFTRRSVRGKLVDGFPSSTVDSKTTKGQEVSSATSDRLADGESLRIIK